MKIKSFFNTIVLSCSIFTPILANAELSKCSEEWVHACLKTPDSLR